MARRPIRTRLDQFVFYLDGDFPAPVAAQVASRLNRNRETSQLHTQARRHDNCTGWQIPAETIDRRAHHI